MPDPIFIFMLTLRDETVPQAREVARRALAAGVRPVGFKDVGAPPDALRAIAGDLRAAGATNFRGAVSLDEAPELASAELAPAVRVARLAGGTRPPGVAPLV